MCKGARPSVKGTTAVLSGLEQRARIRLRAARCGQFAIITSKWASFHLWRLWFPGRRGTADPSLVRARTSHERTQYYASLLEKLLFPCRAHAIPHQALSIEDTLQCWHLESDMLHPRVYVSAIMRSLAGNMLRCYMLGAICRRKARH